MAELSPPIEKVYAAYDAEDERVRPGLELLRGALGAHAVKEVANLEEADAVIALGGDGAFARAAREHGYSSTPMAGVNTGTLGFYMGTDPNARSLDYLVRNMAEGDYRVADLPVVELRTEDDKLVSKAINEIIVKAPGFQAFIASLVVEGTQFDNFIGGGLSFVTPQGSTAEGFSDGGPMIAEGSPVWVVVPKSPHRSEEYFSLESPFVMSSLWKAVVEVKATKYRPFIVGGDGRDIDWPGGNVLKLSLGTQDPVRRIRLKDHTYIDDIARKFRGQRKV